MKRHWFGWVGVLVIGGSLWGSTLRKTFETPPAAARPECWWHWTSNFVTKAGITADLEAMEKVGIGGAHLFLVPFSDTPKGPDILTPEWLELFQFASEEAKRLGLTLGVHNCPGWSSSGGPWITPELSMQALVWSTVECKGPGKIRQKMQLPLVREGFYRDIRVMALPVPETIPVPTISCDLPGVEPKKWTDNDATTAVVLPVKFKEASCDIRLEYAAPITACTLMLTFGDQHLFAKGEVAVSDDAKLYHRVAAFNFERENDLNGPKYISLGEKPVTGRYWRITFSFPGFPGWWHPQDLRLAEVKLLPIAMIEEIEMKNSSANRFSYAPPRQGKGSVGIDPEKVIDLTTKLDAEGTLEWDAPKGNWLILRLGHTSTGKKNAPASLSGLECDKLSKRGLDKHFPAMVGTLLKAGSLDAAIIDSYEAGGQNWTLGFEREFESRRGYPMDSYYPVLAGYVVVNEKVSAKFLYDFQRTVADLFAENYYDYFTELCHKNGIKAILETYGGPFEYLRCSRSADIPANEFWMGGAPNKLAGSIAHIYGKQMAAAEAFTSSERRGHGKQDPAMLKEYGDNAWLNGVNKLMLHSFVHQPWKNVKPGLTLGPWGSMLNRNNTWWNQFDPYIAYLNRSQALLSAGKPVADLLILSGESNPNHLPTRGELTVAGFDYDYCNTDTIFSRLSVADGNLVLPDGTSYAMLHLGNDRYLTLPLLEKVRELVEAGATVAGVAPVDSPSLSGGEAARIKWSKLCDELFGDEQEGVVRRLGNGRMIVCSRPLDALRQIKLLPDIVLPAGVTAIHRRVDDDELYFIRNGNASAVRNEMGFRVAIGLEPQLWDAESGRIAPAPLFRREGPYCYVDLVLEGKGSRFVVFVPENSGKDHPVSAIAAPAGKLEIIEAHFFAEESPAQSRDVTAAMRKLVTPAGICVEVTPKMLGIADPAPGRYKLLRVRYRDDAVTGEVTIGEKRLLELRALPAIDSPLQIRRAIYRAKGARKGHDVTWELRALQTPVGVDFTVTNHLLGGDVAPGKAKELCIDYALHGIMKSVTVAERDRVRLDTGIPIDSSIMIDQAIYRACGAKTGRNVAETIRCLISPDGLFFQVNNEMLGGDPAPMKPKELFLTWRIGMGKVQSRTVKERGNVEIFSGAPAPIPAPTVIAGPNGNRMARFEKAGVLAIGFASGKQCLLVSPELPEALKLDRNWWVTFPQVEAPADTVLLPELTPWNEMKNDTLRYFSGTAEYRRDFELPSDALQPNREWVLDFGNVKNLLSIEINGVNAGILWHMPFRLDVARYLKPGHNELRLKVTNLWTNRLIGDLRIPGREKMRGRIPEWVALDLPKSEFGRTTYSGWGGYRADDELQVSGLLGPVRLRPAALIPLNP